MFRFTKSVALTKIAETGQLIEGKQYLKFRLQTISVLFLMFNFNLFR